MADLKAGERNVILRYLMSLNLEDLKSLAFDLGVNYRLFAYRTSRDFPKGFLSFYEQRDKTKRELARELINYFERKEKLYILVHEILGRSRGLIDSWLDGIPFYSPPLHWRSPLKKILTRYTPGLPLVKIQVMFSVEVLQDLHGFFNWLADEIGVEESDIVLIGSARNPMSLLLGLPAEKANDRKTHARLRRLRGGKYQIDSVNFYDELDDRRQLIWRVIAIEWPPQRQGRVLFPSITWEEADKEFKLMQSTSFRIREARQQLIGFVFDILSFIFNKVFSNTIEAAETRKRMVFAFFLILWALLGLRHPFIVDFIGLPGFMKDPIGAALQSFMACIRMFFAVDTIRYFIAIFFPMFVAFWFASLYLDDVFALEDLKVAIKFILRRAFNIGSEVLLIKEGEQPTDKESPLVRIGGPGKVGVYMENVAVFEGVEGTPRVISSSSSPVVAERKPLVTIDGFERLRKVIDLRDHYIDDLDIRARTKDGIEISIKDARLVFSVFRGRPDSKIDSNTIEQLNRDVDEQQGAVNLLWRFIRHVGSVVFRKARKNEPRLKASSLRQPYSYEEEAIRYLVYRAGSKSLWTATVKSLVATELRTFIARHNLSELLSNIVPEKENARELGFIPREEITSHFEREFSKKAESRGFQLEWLGIGTWKPELGDITEGHLEFWKKNSENEKNGSPLALSDLYNHAHYEEILRIIRSLALETPLDSDRPVEVVKRELLLSCREIFYRVWRSYYEHGKTPPARVDMVLRHLNRLCAEWL